MAETRARLNNEVAPSLSPSIDFTEFGQLILKQDFHLSLANLDTPVPDNGRIDYVTHINHFGTKIVVQIHVLVVTVIVYLPIQFLQDLVLKVGCLDLRVI